MKTPISFFVLLLSLSYYPCFGQETIILEWARILGGYEDDFAESIQHTSDGGYIIAGFSTSDEVNVGDNYGGQDYWVVKLNAQGNLIWQKNLGGSSNEIAYSVRETMDGGYVVAGESISSDFDVSDNNGGQDFWIVKLDEDGEIVWEKNYGGSEPDFAYCIQQTMDGGYIVAGESKSGNFDVGDNYGGSDYWVIRLNGSGNLIWEKNFGGSGFDRAYDICETIDGGFIVSGASSSNDFDVTNPLGGQDIWVVKLTSGGVLDWERSFGSPMGESGYAIQQTSDGGYIVGGDEFLIKMDEGGDLEWETDLSPAEIRTLAIDANGILVAGENDAPIQFGSKDYWIAKVDEEGNFLWEKFYGGVEDPDYAREMDITDDGGLVVAGYVESDDIPDFLDLVDYWILKFKQCPPENVLNNSISICDGESYSIGNSTYTQTGMYVDTLRDSDGCDTAVYITDLTVHPLFEENQITDICQGDTYSVGNSTYSETGTYVDNLQSIEGCDSTINLDLTVHPTYSIQVDTTICPGEQAPVNPLQLFTVEGCDSIINYDILFMTDVADAGISDTICNPDQLLTAEIPSMSTGVWTSDNPLLIIDDINAPETNAYEFQPGPNQLFWTLSHSDCPDFSTDNITVFFYDWEPIIATDDFFTFPNPLSADYSVIQNDVVPDLSAYHVNLTSGLSPDIAPLSLGQDGRFVFDLDEVQINTITAQFGYRVFNTICPEAVDEATATLVFDPEDDRGLPLIFTPNGDGVNDLFIIPELLANPDLFPNNELLVFNRWGQVVFQQLEYDNSWDGRHFQTGKLLPDGTYFYMLFAIESGKLLYQEVSLIR